MLKAWYQLANDSFTEQFCENIDAPQLECKGSCFIENQFEESVEKQSISHQLLSPPAAMEVFLLPELFGFEIPVVPSNANLMTAHFFSIKEWQLLSPQPPPKQL